MENETPKGFQRNFGRNVKLALFLLLATVFVFTITAWNGLVLRSAPKQEKFVKSDGVIDLAEVNSFQFYNRNGSPWCMYSFGKGCSSNKETSKFAIAPFAYHPDYYLLRFVITRKSKNYIEVVVNEDSGLKKYIHNNLRGAETETWEEHILNLFAVDTRENQLYDKPNGNKTKSFPYAIMRIIPRDVKGD